MVELLLELMSSAIDVGVAANVKLFDYTRESDWKLRQ